MIVNRAGILLYVANGDGYEAGVLLVDAAGTLFEGQGQSSTYLQFLDVDLDGEAA